MRSLAITLAAANAGVCLLLFVLNLILVRWWRQEYGWFSQAALLAVGAAFLAIRALLGGWDSALWITLAALVPVIPLAAWRLSFTVRPPRNR